VREHASIGDRHGQTRQQNEDRHGKAGGGTREGARSEQGTRRLRAGVQARQGEAGRQTRSGG
jgi:hypothetical protein